MTAARAANAVSLARYIGQVLSEAEKIVRRGIITSPDLARIVTGQADLLHDADKCAAVPKERLGHGCPTTAEPAAPLPTSWWR